MGHRLKRVGPGRTCKDVDFNFSIPFLMFIVHVFISGSVCPSLLRISYKFISFLLSEAMTPKCWSGSSIHLHLHNIDDDFIQIYVSIGSCLKRKDCAFPWRAKLK